MLVLTDPLLEATVQATGESIVNALIAARTSRLGGRSLPLRAGSRPPGSPNDAREPCARTVQNPAVSDARAASPEAPGFPAGIRLVRLLPLVGPADGSGLAWWRQARLARGLPWHSA